MIIIDHTVSEEQTRQILQKINIGWWGCVGTIVMYSFVTLLFKSLPFGEGLKIFLDMTKASLIFSLLIISFVSIMLPFTIFGRKRIQRILNSKRIMKFGFIRLGFMEVPIILGTMVFTLLHSYEIYIIFFSISILGLIYLRGENNFYFEILNSINTKGAIK